MERDLLLDFQNISKNYGKFPALSNISFSVNQGDSIAIVGPNGAGKSTLLGILCGLTPISSGQIYFQNKLLVKETEEQNKSTGKERNIIKKTKKKQRNINRKEINRNMQEFRNLIGYCPQTTTLDEMMTAQENLELQLGLYHSPIEQSHAKIQDILNEVGLLHRADDRVEHFSGGMKRRLEIARAILSNPKILILDEPTLGLDPAAKNHIWTFLKEIQKQRQITLIVTTNNMEEAQTVCKRLIFLNHGQLLLKGEQEKILSFIGKQNLSIKLRLETPLAKKKWEELQKSVKFSDIQHRMVNSYSSDIYIPNSSEEEMEQVLKVLKENYLHLNDLKLTKSSLDEAFIHFMGKTDRTQSNYPELLGLLTQNLFSSIEERKIDDKGKEGMKE